MDPEITQEADPITIAPVEAPIVPSGQGPLEKKPRKSVPMTESRLAHLRALNENRSAAAKARHALKKTASKAERERARYDQLHAKYGTVLVQEPLPPPQVAVEAPQPTPAPYVEPQLTHRGPPLRYAPPSMALNFV